MNFTKSRIYEFCCTLLLIVCHESVNSQNIVPNSDFEVFTVCPDNFGTGGMLTAIPWQNANMGSSDYFHACGLQDWTTVPHNSLGYQAAHSGVAYAGGYYLASDFREYLQTPFSEPMDPNFSYLVSFYVNLAEDVSGCGIADFGVYFSNTPLMSADASAIPVTPQLTTNGVYYTDTAAWMLFTACYNPVGGEQWMTIGNFNSDSNTPVDPSCNAPHTTYYFIDDVYVIKGGDFNGIDFDLGGPVSACNSYTIDPGLPGVSYLWGNGSTETVLTVTESGVYRLTVTDGCKGGIDSITVVIENGMQINIGPDTVTICAGDTYQVLLNPDSGIYTWQDGSNAVNYDIVEAGLYYVTLDNGECETSDTILIEVDDPPSSISLGDDLILCMGEVFVVDPNLSGFDFLWHNGSTLPTFQAMHTDEISLTVLNMCGTASDTMNVLFLSAPLPFDLGVDTLLCPGESLLLEVPQSDMLVMWQDGSNQLFYLADEAQVYSLTLSNQCGSLMDELTVSFDTANIVLGFDTTVLLCPDETIILDVQQTFPATYSWNTGSPGYQIVIEEPGTYIATVGTSCQTDSKSFEVIGDPECSSSTKVYVPNTFSPNGDGFNDVFIIGLVPGFEIIRIDCEIFDRWGNQVFYSESYPVQWDGKFGDTDLNPGVYVYSININYVEFGEEQSQVLTGGLTLIR